MYRILFRFIALTLCACLLCLSLNIYSGPIVYAASLPTGDSISSTPSHFATQAVVEPANFHLHVFAAYAKSLTVDWYYSIRHPLTPRQPSKIVKTARRPSHNPIRRQLLKAALSGAAYALAVHSVFSYTVPVTVEAADEDQTTKPTPAKIINERWLRNTFADSARGLFDKSSKGTLTGAEFKIWLDTTLRDFGVRNPPFLSQLVIPERVSRDFMWRVWDQLNLEVFRKAGYVVHIESGDRSTDRIGRVLESETALVQKEMDRIADGLNVPVVVVDPLNGTLDDAVTTLSYIIIPKSFVDDSTLRVIQLARKNGWQDQNPVLKMGSNSTADARQLLAWIKQYTIGVEENIKTARQINWGGVLIEERTHYALMLYLLEKTGIHPHSMTPTQLFDAYDKYVLGASAAEQRKGARDFFMTFNDEQKAVAVNRLIELHGQLYVIARSEHATLDFAKLNLQDDTIVHGPAWAEIRSWLSSGVLGKETGQLSDWNAYFTDSLMKGVSSKMDPLDRITTVRTNIERLDILLRSVAQKIMLIQYTKIPGLSGTPAAAISQDVRPTASNWTADVIYSAWAGATLAPTFTTVDTNTLIPRRHRSRAPRSALGRAA